MGRSGDAHWEVLLMVGAERCTRPLTVPPWSCFLCQVQLTGILLSPFSPFLVLGPNVISHYRVVKEFFWERVIKFTLFREKHKKKVKGLASSQTTEMTGGQKVGLQ